jgi:hypothetical protein
MYHPDNARAFHGDEFGAFHQPQATPEKRFVAGKLVRAERGGVDRVGHERPCQYPRRFGGHLRPERFDLDPAHFTPVNTIFLQKQTKETKKVLFGEAAN